MRNAKWLLAAGLVAVTAGCVETTSSGYPNSSYNRGYYNNGAYAGNNGTYAASNSGGYYASDGRYYSNNTASSSSANPFYSPSATRAAQQPYRDSDRDGVPNRYDVDANGDGIPDRYQR